tara:strand:+ start:331 stop:519 length:189 start_codon:yes stop_codon:yes gene_type:complete
MAEEEGMVVGDQEEDLLLETKLLVEMEWLIGVAEEEVMDMPRLDLWQYLLVVDLVERVVQEL